MVFRLARSFAWTTGLSPAAEAGLINGLSASSTSCKKDGGYKLQWGVWVSRTTHRPPQLLFTLWGAAGQPRRCRNLPIGALGCGAVTIDVVHGLAPGRLCMMQHALLGRWLGWSLCCCGVPTGVWCLFYALPRLPEAIDLFHGQ